MFDSDLFRIGDKVFYAGEKYRDRLHGKPGWIHAAVSNQEGVWVVEFPDTRSKDDEDDSDDYVLSSRVLTKRTMSQPKKDDHFPEVQPRRRRKGDDE